MHSALSRFLDRLLLRSDLGPVEREAVLNLNSESIKYRPNHDIVRPGETVGQACLIASGLAARFDAMRDGKRQITAFYLPGDMCDLHSVVAPTAAWGIVALGTPTVLKIPHAELRAASRSFPRLAEAFWRDGIADSSVLAKWIGNLGRRNSKQRLAHLLCEIGNRMELAGLGERTQFHFDVSQNHLADALGITAVHFNRTLQSIRADGLVVSNGRIIEIEDWDRLASLAEFDPAYLLLRAEHSARRTD